MGFIQLRLDSVTMDDNLACPRCKTTKYRNPSLKLLVNTCGHALCDNCYLFWRVSGLWDPTPSLRLPSPTLEDPAVEKEVDIRRRVLRDYSKQEADFPSLREYNDYLEQVETIIFNLANNIDIIETNKLIEQYKKENKEQITKSRTRKPTQILLLEAIIEEENRRSELRHMESLHSAKEEKIRKQKNHEALIDDLMFLESDAKAIVESHKATQAHQQVEASEIKPLPSQLGISSLSSSAPQPAYQQATTFTSGIGFGGSASFLPLPKGLGEVPLFVYKAFLLEIGGPPPPSLEQLKYPSSGKEGHLQHIRPATEAEIAGGYHHAIACRRALQDAFMDIAMQPKLLKSRSIQNESESESTTKEEVEMDTS
ncbi:CDK-activating kinase assembly factor MAT1 [Orchesella cincta]|uniref:CDK-activating kinase assembly factor MAT1 n=1 Tax=Orchesella cincta TaxID=48709 RepID=A0A1D2N123_ORCCI|nr:CDK-activating kinase assembly factor MAT1 [Orchesella cincta]